jgi:septum formation protein
MQLILGSSSASRRLILSEMGYQFTLLVGDFPPSFSGVGLLRLLSCDLPLLFSCFPSIWIQSADIDEKEIRMEKPEELVVALAHAKVISFPFLLPKNLVLLSL